MLEIQCLIKQFLHPHKPAVQPRSTEIAAIREGYTFENLKGGMRGKAGKKGTPDKGNVQKAGTFGELIWCS